jgi:hypothetical protein
LSKQSGWISLVFLTAFALAGCNNDGYGHEEAIKRGDIVFLNKVINFERFEQFLNNLSNKNEDIIRITGYTDEGDPIFQDLKYDGKVIRYSYNNSNDAYGGSDKGLRKDVCTDISEEISINGEIEYTISGCSKKSKDMSYFLLRVPK